jgi:molybdate transport system substrate-binding protein
VPGSRFTYASGQLVLIGPALTQASPQQSIANLLQSNTGKLAIANPATAPYGLAAQQLLQHLDLWTAQQPHLLRASNIAQAYQFVDSGGAALGLVAYSQTLNRPGAYRLIPMAWHQPIEQQAVLLQTGRDNPAALAFITFLHSVEARAIIASDGYRTGGEN